MQTSDSLEWIKLIAISYGLVLDHLRLKCYSERTVKYCRNAKLHKDSDTLNSFKLHSTPQRQHISTSLYTSTFHNMIQFLLEASSPLSDLESDAFKLIISNDINGNVMNILFNIHCIDSTEPFA